MREKIETIIAELVSGSGTTPKKAIDEILLLFNVSGNEAHPKENKKVGEVALPPANHKWEIADEHWEICRCGCGLARERRQ